jgi:hypothetical protein
MRTWAIKIDRFHDRDILRIAMYRGWGAHRKITSIDKDDADAMDEVIEIDGDEVALGDMDAVDEEDEIIGISEDEMACVHLTLITRTRLSLKAKAISLLTMRRTKLLLMTRRMESLS